MTVTQFLDYLASYPQSRELASELCEIVVERSDATLRRSA
jgi:hypothetical protein